MDNKIEIDGVTLYVEDLREFGRSQDSRSDHRFSVHALTEALEPVARIGQAVGEKMQSLAPDETELTLQLTMGVDGDRLVFGLVKTSAEAMLSVKFLWKKEDNAATAG